MISIQDITKSYGNKTVLEKISFNLNAGERIAVIGPNGCGKTTLLRILAGVETADSGRISKTPASLRIGYLPQKPVYPPQISFGEALAAGVGDPDRLAEELERVSKDLAGDPDSASLHARFDDLLAALTYAEVALAKLPGILKDVGLDGMPADQDVNSLSGGEKTRLNLALLLTAEPEVLLLDEPTNHLDIRMLSWLEGWINAYKGAILLVSHDRLFIDATCNQMLEISMETHGGKVYTGNYTAYLEQKVQERVKQWAAYQDQNEEIDKLKKAVEEMQNRTKFHRGGKADAAQGDKFAAAYFANRSKRVIKRSKALEGRVEELQTTKRLQKPGRSWDMKLDFAPVGDSGRDVLVMNNLDVGYGDQVLVADISATLNAGARTALVGPNGSGKSTLMRTILGEIPPLSGNIRLGSRVQPGFMDQEQKELHDDLNSLENLRLLSEQTETELRSFLSYYLLTGDDVFIPTGALSMGQRARLALAMLVLKGCNLLLLDEPVNHLDIPSRSQFEQALQEFNGTILTAAHDRYFLQNFAQELWKLDDGSMQVIRRGELGEEYWRELILELGN